MPSTPLRVIGIARQSVSDDDSQSPEQQAAYMRAHAKREGWQLLPHVGVDGVLIERDVSGRTPLAKRPGLRTAVELVEAGEADIVMGMYFDRLMRSLRVQDELVTRVEAKGARVLALDTGRITNGTAGQWLSGTLLGAVAEYHIRTTAERVAQAQAENVRKGIMPTGAYWPGYRKGDDGVLRIVPVESEHVAEGFRLRLAGASVQEVRDYWNAHGIDLNYSGTQRYLRNRVVLGEVNFGQLRNAAAHSPIVDADVFADVGELRIPRGRVGKSPRLLARLSVLVCGTCGTRMTVNPGNGKRTPPFYYCHSKTTDCPRRVAITAHAAEDAVWQRARTEAIVFQGRADATAQARAAAADADSLEQHYANLIELLTGRENVANAKAKLDAAELAAINARAKAKRLASSSAALTIDVDSARLTMDDRRGVITRFIHRAHVAPGGAGAGRITFEVFSE